jgi:flagellar basal-body rod protein FlgG
MIRALYTAASGMTAQQMNVDNIANNLANANTTGYKMRRTQFQDLMYQNVTQPGTAAGAQTTVPTGLQVGLGTRSVANEIVLTEGSPSQTNNSLDLVIQGKGFFQVTMPTGEISYTRDGSFQLDKEGHIVTASGDLLEPPITIPADAQNISIANDGTVSYTQGIQTTTVTGGQIQLALFQNPAGLNAVGGNLFTATDASGQPTIANPAGTEGAGSLLQGYLEQSNVSVVQEFINLIAAQRGYEANSKVVKAADEMYQQVNNIPS